MTVFTHIFTHILPSLGGMVLRVFTQVVAVGKSP